MWTKKCFDFDKGYYFSGFEFLLYRPRHQKEKKELRQDKKFSTRLPYVNKKLKGVFLSMMDTKYITIGDRIDNLQNLKDETKVNSYQNIGIYYDEKIYHRQSGYFQLQKHPFVKIPKV